MKIFAVTSCLFLFLISIFVSAYFKPEYQSAFEADQACHSEKWSSYGDNPSFDCDHDLETNKWILYEMMPNHMPAKVIKRYRY